MMQHSFLDKIAVELLQKHKQRLSDVVVVLPNRRAKLFLFQALQRNTDANIFAPEVISIEDFIQDIAGVRAVDSIELLFEFFEVYLQTTKENPPQTFESFANWAKTLVQDFNEIDRYLLPPSKVLSYLKDIEDIKHWSLNPDGQTELIKKHLQFWEVLPHYYESFYQHLLSKGIGYQGLIYREAVNNLEHYTSTIKNQVFVFAGFNALNAAEEKIIQHLLEARLADVYWDIDEAFLKDPYHDAGLFLRRFKSQWRHYKHSDFKWVDNSFSRTKNLNIIGTPKMIGQAKIVGKIIEDHISENPQGSLDKVAIILAEESLLVPLIYYLPTATGALNITMGYSAKNNPAQILLSKLFRLHTNAQSRDAARYLFYYKDLLDVLTHPLVEPYAGAEELVRIINANNYTFLSWEKVQELLPRQTRMFVLLFTKWNSGAPAVLDLLAELLLLLKANLSSDIQQDRIARTFVFALFKTVNKLQNYYARHKQIDDIGTLQSIYKQVIELAEVSFEGEPLHGLQVMGVLESRVLDFETVIITSVNEGKFPAGKSSNSFIPYDVKRELGLPTFKEKDAIYTYHFYHLLQRAKNVFLLYNTESEGLDAGEKSRFITQLMVETQESHKITHKIFNANLPDAAYIPAVVSKSPSIMIRLKQISEKGFSPSALTNYIRNPMDFYYKKILGIRDVDEVEENIALNTLGTIIHEALRSLLAPYIGKILTEEDIQSCRGRIDSEVLEQFRVVYKQGEISKGRNLLAFEVAKRNVWNFLKVESEALRNNEVVKILHLEEPFTVLIESPKLPFPVLIGGTVDRIEERDGIIRIIDYKTGRVDQRDLTLKCWDNLTADIKNDKIIQILAYAKMIRPMYPDRIIEACIISFKNIKCGFMPFQNIEDKIRKTVIDDEIMELYEQQLILLLNEVLDNDILFTEKVT